MASFAPGSHITPHTPHDIPTSVSMSATDENEDEKERYAPSQSAISAYCGSVAVNKKTYRRLSRSHMLTVCGTERD
ncbi:hypothetical protein ACLKA7_015796 [Drosophila subpalustris]